MQQIGRYKIVKELGRGAMGVVYHAIDPSIGRPVAIKTIRLRDVHKDEEREKLRERLFREARSAGILSHPNIVTIYDVDEAEGAAYIAMEFVDGPTLDYAMAGPAPLGRERVIPILRQSAAALDYAHGKHIVHRDIKPANLMLAEGGVVKVTDFGIAKIATAENYTLTGNIVGTPNYMSPEQIQGHSVDGRADQFSLAVIAFEMLTGERPFAGEHLTTVVYKIVAEDVVSPQKLNPTLGPRIDGVLRKALAKKPDARFANCAAFVDALEQAAAATPGWKNLARGAVASLPTVVEPGPRLVKTPSQEKLPLVPVGPAEEEAASGPPLPPPRRRARDTEELPRRKSRVVPLLAALLVGGGLIALVAWQFQQGGGPAEKSETASAAPAAPGAREKKPSPMAPAESAAPAQDAGAPSRTAEAQEAAPPPADEAVSADNKADTKAETKPEAGPAAGAAEPAPPPVVPKPPVDAKPDASAARQASPVRPAPAGRPQPVGLVTSPGGATVTVDGRREFSCRTPCTLELPPGRHNVSFALAGHHTELREVFVGSTASEFPMVTLQTSGGVLMLSSDPQGARITINGKPVPHVTPAKLPLAPGTYNVTVEKDGRRRSEQVLIGSGIRAVRIPLE